MDAAASIANEKDPAKITAWILRNRAPDVIEALNEMSPQDAARMLANMPIDRAIESFDTPGLDHADAILAALPRAAAASILRGISTDRLAESIRGTKEPLRGQLIALLDAAARAALDHVLSWPEDSAGSIMTTEFVAVSADRTVGETLDYIRTVERRSETIYSICILDPTTKALVNVVSLRRLISADPAAAIASVSPNRKIVTIGPRESRDEATRLISRYDLLAIPVVDEARRVLGIVTVDDAIDAMVERQTEEVQRFGGVGALDQSYLDVGFGRMIWKRAGWLCALFLSEMLTASAMQGFQSELERAVVLTLFIPLIMSSGGNSGSQATSLLIRAIALNEIRLRDWWRVALREIPTGIVLGAILGAIGIARIALWQGLGLFNYGEHWLLVALTVGFALVGIVTFGSLSGSMLPFALKRLGFDPATASAPFVATLVDVTGLVIYFSVALVILHGTLL